MTCRNDISVSQGSDLPTVAVTDNYAYESLHPWQTRVLCLYPTAISERNGWNASQLCADLKVVTLHTLEGVWVEDTGEIIGYEALSYSWGRPKLSENLICNGASLPISADNATALKALRDKSRVVYLWIDAICINQADSQEKSEQVANMLSIFKKARAVIVWLGTANADSLLAFACFNNVSALREDLRAVVTNTHSRSCLLRIRTAYLALLALYARPWLGRAWVRQEVYAARKIFVRCDHETATWEAFLDVGNMMKMMGLVSPNQDVTWRAQEAQIQRLLAEAQANSVTPSDGAKPPRALADVLTHSKHFGVTNPRDTLYAILGMCNVTSYAKSLTSQHGGPRHGVLVDYSKPLVEVLHDATLSLLGRERSSKTLAGLWHSYRRTLAHTKGLRSWAVDWQSGEGTFDDLYRSRLRHHGIDDGINSGFTYELRVEHARDWIPLRASPDAVSQQISLEHWPKPLNSDSSVLCLGVRFLNYVAHLTKYTSTLDDFLRCDHPVRGLGLSSVDTRPSHPILGPEGQSIHVRDVPRRGSVFLDPSRCTHLIPFDAELHHWRVAILGSANDGQVCLVPSTAKKGDLIIAVGPGVLPMAVRPLNHDLFGDLIPQPDPFESVPYGNLSNALEVVIQSLTFVLLPAIAGFNVALANMTDLSPVSAVLLVFFGSTLTVLLAGNLLSIRSCLGRQYNHPLSSSDLLGLGAAEWFLLITCVGTFPYSLANTAGTRRLVLGAYFVFTMSTILIGVIWRYCRRLSDSIMIAIRRDEIIKFLDHVTQVTGRDYVFYGPVFVKARRYRWRLSPRLDSINVRWWIFRLGTILTNMNTTRPRHLDNTDPDWFHTEVHTRLGDDVQRNWQRPLQEIRLH